MSGPIIGVMPLWDDDKESMWMLPGYFEGIRQEGGIPIMLPLSSDVQEIDQLMTMCDGILFTGGHDVSPSLYGETPLSCVSCCDVRDKMEMIVLKKVIADNKPALGICRGIQFINAALGGTLYQDLPTQFSSETEHHQTPPYDIPVHAVEIIRDTPLHQCLKKDNMRVNSYHHQAVKKTAPVLKPMAIAEDGLVEGLYMPDHRFLWAIQWHPEFSYANDDNSKRIFGAFVQASMDNT